MYSQLIDYYSKYQNDRVKHDGTEQTPEELTNEEAEFIIYVTGSLMRFIILIQKITDTVY